MNIKVEQEQLYGIRAASAIDAEEQARIHNIRKAILEAGNELRQKYPWLVKYQDQIGLAIMGVAVTGILYNSIQLLRGKMPWYVVVPLNAFWMSILHELEHDLIHKMYFRKNKLMNDFMLGVVYLFRPSTINPWTRKRLHLHHHVVSGTESDMEERGITNGEKWGLRRLLMTGDNMLSVYLRPFETSKMLRTFVNAQKTNSKAEKKAIYRENNLGYFPLGTTHYALWHGYLGMKAAKWVLNATGSTLPQHATWQKIEKGLQFYAQTIAGPNFLRTFALHFVSSNMHYYGDVQMGNPIQQCQVWTDKRLLPLHAFCFNFGATHAIHHFVVRDPFYIRQAIAHKCYPTMQENGVRFNDFGALARANRRN